MFISRSFRPVSVFAAAAGLAAVSLVAGCSWTPGGSAWSLDRYTYESSAYQPQTVSIVDTRTQQVVRTWEIPVGKKLQMEFFTDVAGGTSDSPDKLDFDLCDAASDWSTPTQSMFVPPRWARRVDMKLRPVPELVGGGVGVAAGSPGAPVLPGSGNAPMADAGAGGGASAGGGSAAAAGGSTGGGSTGGAAASGASGGMAAPGQPMVPAKSAAGATAGGAIVPGRYYLVAARLTAEEADKAVGALNGGGVAARVMTRDDQAWVVVTAPSYSDAEYSHPSSVANRDAVLLKVMAIGQSYKQSGGTTNFTMATWEQWK